LRQLIRLKAYKAFKDTQRRHAACGSLAARRSALLGGLLQHLGELLPRVGVERRGLDALQMRAEELRSCASLFGS